MDLSMLSPESSLRSAFGYVSHEPEEQIMNCAATIKALTHLVIPSDLEYSSIRRIIPRVPVRVGMR